MSASSFQSVVYYGSQGIEVFSSSKKGWKSIGTFGVDEAPSAKVKKALGQSVLVLVSDAYNGHLQVVFPNKKSELTDENIAKVLEKDYEIETDAYEFASQKFTLSREQVQLSISGVERETYQKIQEWLTPFSPQKAWVMPFGWFVSALKSVEPVLLAIAISDSQILVSHHYLGVDDAREINLKDLVPYIKARKNERKETHLLYVQAEAPLQKKIEKAVGETVALHPLIEDTESETALSAVIEAVWSKGEDALAELLHFEMDGISAKQKSEDAATASTTAKEKSEDAETEVADLDADTDVLPASDLPKPNLPDIEEDLEDDEDAASSTSEAGETVEAVEPSEDETTVVNVTEIVSTTVAVTESSDKGTDADEPAQEPESVAEPSSKSESSQVISDSEPELEDDSDSEEKPFFADLTPSAGVARSSESRYREVPKKSSWKAAIFVFLTVVILTSVIGGAIFWSQQTVGEQQSLLPTATPSPTPIIEADPEATAAAETTDLLAEEEKEELSVLVLNATGIAGLAGRTRTELQDAGWTDVAVGNATGTYDDALFIYTENEQVIPTLEDDLEVELTEASSISESGSDEYDVVFIIADEVSWQ